MVWTKVITYRIQRTNLGTLPKVLKWENRTRSRELEEAWGQVGMGALEYALSSAR